MTAPMLLRMPATMRRVNDLIWESLGRGGHADPVAFFCECAQEGCYRPVWLTPAEYEQSRRQPDWLAVSASHRAESTRMIEQPPLKRDLRCTICGYGVARLQPPDRCPMCAGTRWQQHPPRRSRRAQPARGA